MAIGRSRDTSWILLVHRCPEKGTDNFDKFRQLFTIFGKNHRDIRKMSHQYLHTTNYVMMMQVWRKCDVSEKCHFRKNRNAGIHSASTVASKFAEFESSTVD